MADLPPYSTPRWVKIFGMIVIGLVLLVVIVLLVATALGLHTPGGPGRHVPHGDTPFQIPLRTVTEDATSSAGNFAIHTSPLEHGMQQ